MTGDVGNFSKNLSEERRGIFGIHMRTAELEDRAATEEQDLLDTTLIFKGLTEITFKNTC